MINTFYSVYYWFVCIFDALLAEHLLLFLLPCGYFTINFMPSECQVKVSLGLLYTNLLLSNSDQPPKNC